MCIYIVTYNTSYIKTKFEWIFKEILLRHKNTEADLAICFILMTEDNKWITFK